MKDQFGALFERALQAGLRAEDVVLFAVHPLSATAAAFGMTWIDQPGAPAIDDDGSRIGGWFKPEQLPALMAQLTQDEKLDLQAARDQGLVPIFYVTRHDRYIGSREDARIDGVAKA